ncbi:acyl carrier protein [Providencia rettgeri]|uniref:acyl carrier protein n=1 Tax=Providencia rettgeri TaxID=587 RepID=UPI002AB3ABCD|nr:acyl carrier protein [Providencia stuartii]
MDIKPNNIHWLWLVEQIQQIRTYSGITNSYTMDSALIVDVHIDSLEMLELITAIEQYIGQGINDEVWMKWRYLRDIVDYLSNVK